jgi:hypothetical protein
VKFSPTTSALPFISAAASPCRPSFAPVLLTPVVLVVHGFHPFANDAGIYAAGIRHILDPSLYPLNAGFVTAFTRLSIFPWAMAALVRILHLPLAWVLLLAQLGSIYFFLCACLLLAQRLWIADAALWAVVLLAAACFTLPVAGTALSVMDPYVTARSFSTPLALLAVAACLDRRPLRTGLFLLLAMLIHPLVGAYAAAFVLLCAAIAAGRLRLAAALCTAAILAGGFAFAVAHRIPPSAAYRQVLSLEPRSFLFLARWHWYEVLGLVLPLLLFALAARKSLPCSRIRILCLTSILLGTTNLIAAAAFVPASGPYLLVPLQVLRGFHLVYCVGIVLCGGMLGRLLQRSPALTLATIAVLMAGMCAAQRLSCSGCAPVEWPEAAPVNPWQQAFLWIRANTPAGAIFAFNPRLVYLPGENEQGFRAIAERDQLADDKDAGVAAVFPRLARRWARQRNAELDVDQMTDAERAAVLIPLGASWLLLPPDAATAFPCPYRNEVAAVCKMAP